VNQLRANSQKPHRNEPDSGAEADGGLAASSQKASLFQDVAFNSHRLGINPAPFRAAILKGYDK
jgi:hypothetical protein